MPHGLAMTKPTDATAVQRLNRMVCYLSQFLTNLTSVIKRLLQLVQKTVEWPWGEAQEKDFDKIKYVLYQAPVSAYFDP